jgi:hypothetical protein
MTTSTPPEQTIRTYGGPTVDRPPQFGLTRKLGPLGTGIVFGVMAVVAILSRLTLLGSAIVLLIGGMLLAALTVRDEHNNNGLTRAARKVGWWRTRRRQANVYRSGPYGKLPHGRRQLPGIAARLLLTGWNDSLGREFAVVTSPVTNDHTVTMTTDPDGAALVDQPDVDTKVARYGLLLGGLGAVPGLVGASVMVENGPDSGNQLRREIETQGDPDAHVIAQAYLAEVGQTYPANATVPRSCVALTFTGVGPEGRRKPDEVARDLATRVPGLMDRLRGTGAGAVRSATPADVAEIVHTAYNPAAARQFDEAKAAGSPWVVPWADAGPTAMEAGWEWFRHDRAVSCTYGVTQMPTGAFREGLLAGLLAPHPDIDRTRVTINYRPLTPAATTKAVDAAVSNAERRVKRARSTAVDEKVHEAAKQVAAEVADGAGLLYFSMLVTVTVTDPRRLVRAKAAMESACAAARLTVAPLYGSQPAGFACALAPLGLGPSLHKLLLVPAELRAAA